MESDDAGGGLSVVEVGIPAGTLVQPHRHAHEDEFSYVLEGRLGARLGDDELELTAGAAMVKPRGVPHALWNLGPEPARILEIVAPGGFERYFEEVGPISRKRVKRPTGGTTTSRPATGPRSTGSPSSRRSTGSDSDRTIRLRRGGSGSVDGSAAARR